jgi:hypothetical protein
MTIDGILNLLVQFIYIWVAGITLISWARQRDQSRRDIALVFIALALAIFASDSQRLFPLLAPLFAVLFFCAILIQPYFLLRVARYFQPVFIRIWRWVLPEPADKIPVTPGRIGLLPSDIVMAFSLINRHANATGPQPDIEQRLSSTVSQAGTLSR